MIFNAWKKFDELTIAIKTLWFVIGVLICINILLVMGWMCAPKHLRIYLPPDLSRGAMIKPNQLPKSTIYAFAYQIFTAINTWSADGLTDYKKNINSYRNYLSARFYQTLLADFVSRESSGSLGRERLVTGISGRGYMPNRVKKIGDGVFQVDIPLKIQETVNGSVVKDIVMDYPLIISRVNASIQDNPWGLVISGFSKAPSRIKTNI